MNIEALLTQYGTSEVWTGLQFTGNDTDLEISLVEYGIVWSTEPASDGDLRFIYRTYTEGDRKDILHTSWAAIKPDVDFKREWSWVDWDAFCSFIGLPYDEWSVWSTGLKVADLVKYYGCENIFGTCCHPTLLTTDDDE